MSLWHQIMNLAPEVLPTLAQRLQAERKLQKLSRAQAAAVCNVSTSFVRDAESDPARCSLGKLLTLMRGLGLRLEVDGWSEEPPQGQGDAVATRPAP
jgi:HTH-type transcriptional regulator/antitoxin HipB